MSYVSIIVPVFNVEHLITRCLNSIINQTFTDFEVIVINDGSTDSSGSICVDFAKRDQRIKYIQIENSGLSAARNLGIEKASGNFLFFGRLCMDQDTFRDLLSDLHGRIQRCHRILKNHGNLASSDLGHLIFRIVQKIVSLEQDLCPAAFFNHRILGRKKPHNRFGCHGLSTSGFAYDRKCFSFSQTEVHSSYCM